MEALIEAVRKEFLRRSFRRPYITYCVSNCGRQSSVVWTPYKISAASSKPTPFAEPNCSQSSASVMCWLANELSEL
jgi:hypothetical protein